MKLRNFLVQGKVILVCLLLGFGLSDCGGDADAQPTEDATALGAYKIDDIDEFADEHSYSITLRKINGELEIDNFGDMMFVPIKAAIADGKFSIPAQTFAGKTVTITLSGNGTVTDDMIEFDYLIDTNDGTLIEHSCTAKKQ